MHGMIMVQFRNFMMDGRLGAGEWERLLIQAGAPGQRFSIVEGYPDEMFVRLVGVAQTMTGIPTDDLLVAFGEHVVPGLADLYEAQIRPEWGSLDVIEHTEKAIHAVVRHENPDASPPPLRATRIGPDEVRVSYTSVRRLCSMARGICRGLGRQFGETLEITESNCMLRGDRTCEIVVRRV